jgi:creatinine amidohydrolase
MEAFVMNKFRLDQMTYLETEAYAKKGAIVLQPIGPLEAHGPHLPLSVDYLAAEVMAETSAERLNAKGIPAVMAPVMTIGISEPSKMFSGTVSMKPETLKSVISDIAEAFKHHGFKGTVIVNQHGERLNIETLIKTSAELTERGIPTIMANPIGKIMGKIQDMLSGGSPEGDFHAGEIETSFCLWKCPELVKTEIMKDLKPYYVKQKGGFKSFVEAGATDCYFGAPALGKAELGEAIYEVIVEEIVKEVENWATTL